MGKEGGAWFTELQDKAILEFIAVKQLRLYLPVFLLFLDVSDDEIPELSFIPGCTRNRTQLLEQGKVDLHTPNIEIILKILR